MKPKRKSKPQKGWAAITAGGRILADSIRRRKFYPLWPVPGNRVVRVEIREI